MVKSNNSYHAISSKADFTINEGDLFFQFETKLQESPFNYGEFSLKLINEDFSGEESLLTLVIFTTFRKKIMGLLT
jgi:hypothetical protein